MDGFTTMEELERLAEKCKVAKVLSNKMLAVARADMVQERQVEWIWPGHIAIGEVNLFAGEPGTRKSWMAFDLAARVSTGGPLPCGVHMAPKGKVLIVSGEDGADTTIVPRLRGAGADLSMIHILDVNSSVDFSFERTEMLEQILTSEFKLLVIDPVSCFFNANIDSNNTTDVRGALRGLASLTAKHGAATVLIHHLRKDSGKSAHRIAGSGAFVAMPRSVFVVHEDQDREEVSVMGHVKCNLAKKQPPLEFEVNCDNGVPHLVWRQSTEEILNHCEKAKAGSKSRVQIWLLDILAQGAKPAKELGEMAKSAGISERTLERARAGLKEAGKVVSYRKEDGWWLDLVDRVIEF